MLILVVRFYSDYWKTWLKKLTPDLEHRIHRIRYPVEGVPGGFYPAFNIRIHDADEQQTQSILNILCIINTRIRKYVSAAPDNTSKRTFVFLHFLNIWSRIAKKLLFRLIWFIKVSQCRGLLEQCGAHVFLNRPLVCQYSPCEAMVKKFQTRTNLTKLTEK